MRVPRLSVRTVTLATCRVSRGSPEWGDGAVHDGLVHPVVVSRDRKGNGEPSTAVFGPAVTSLPFPLTNRGQRLREGRMADINEEYAAHWAMKASEASGSDELTEAVGKGLAAVATALLEVADAIRQAADKR